MAVRTLAVPVLRFRGPGPPSPGTDELAEEEPLRIRVSGRDLGILLRTPGDDAALAVGHALGEGLIARPEHLDDVRVCYQPQLDEQLNVAEVLLAPSAPGHGQKPVSARLVGSGCGLCGRAVIEAVLADGRAAATDTRIPAPIVEAMAASLLAAQVGFRRSGGLHAAGLFDLSGELRFDSEDVGRHNAVDKVLGAALLAGHWPPPPLLMVTSRGSFEIVQKAIRAGLALVAFMSAPTSLAVSLATRAGLCLAGFVRPGRFNVYAGRDRLVEEPVP